MSNPSVTATITANDRASPKIRELVELTQRLNKTARSAFNDSLGGRRYADSFQRANAAAMQHLTTLEKIHRVRTAIAARVVGVTGFRVARVAAHAVKEYLPLERETRYQKAVGHFSKSEMALLNRQRVDAAAGTLMRQLAVRMLAPTRAGFEALAAAGIKFEDYAKSGNVGVESMDASLTRRYGHGLSDTGKASLQAALDDPNGSVLASIERAIIVN